MIERWMSYFKKDVNVHIDYLYTKDKKVPDTFNIYITQKNQVHMLTNLEWGEIDRVAEILEEENKPIKLWRQYGTGKEVLGVPKWARILLAKKLREAKREEEERIQKESELQLIAYDVLRISNQKSTFFGYPMLISGIAGSGKTYAVKEILSELVVGGHRVAIVDFRNEYEDVIEKHHGISLTYDEVDHIEESLVRVHFGSDVFYKHDEYNIGFLSKLANEFDYLVIDDAQVLYQDYFHLGSASSLYEVCASLIKQNLNLKIILSTQSLYSLPKKDIESLQGLFGHHLMFRQTPSVEINNRPELLSLEVGEAIFHSNNKPKWLIAFKVKRDGVHNKKPSLTLESPE